jgi:hypothetical protein
MNRAPLLVFVVSALAAAEDRPCTPTPTTASVEVSFKKGSTKLTDVAAWYRKVTCQELEAPLSAADVPITLSLEGKIAAPRVLEVVRAAVASAGYEVHESMRVVRLVKWGEAPLLPATSGGCAVDPARFVAKDDTVEVDTSTMDAFDPSCLMQSARVVPSIKDGKAAGLRLFGIRPGTVFALVGFKNGDTVRSINGRALDAPDAALEAYTTLKDQRKFDVAIERAGAAKTLRIILK